MASSKAKEVLWGIVARAPLTILLLGGVQHTPESNLAWVSSFLSGGGRGLAGGRAKGGEDGRPPRDVPVMGSIPDVFAAVPQKLADKILSLEFVDMADLLPEQWRIEEVQEGACCSRRRSSKKALLTDILAWLDCFSTMVAVLATEHPGKTAHFMAYQQTIIHASKNFTGAAWATYDLCFRRKAATLRSLDWGIVDQDLYSKSFTGRAKATVRCRYCLSDAHTSDECVESPLDVPRKQPAKEICMLFNKPGGNVCRYSPCRYAHMCSKCRRGDHPAADCHVQGRERSPAGRKDAKRPRK